MDNSQIAEIWYILVMKIFSILFFGIFQIICLKFVNVLFGIDPLT
jgi:hypothetical protein